MSKFKVGDYVRRIGTPWAGVPVGKTAFVADTIAGIGPQETSYMLRGLPGIHSEHRLELAEVPQAVRMSVVPGAEADPTGRKASDPGAKLDAGKNRAALVAGGFARALQAVGVVGSKGAAKYTPNGWVTVPDGEARYDDALMRHWLREKAGEEFDPDSGDLHAAHVAWNALARLDLILRRKEAAV